MLTVDDIVAAIRFVVALHEGRETLDAPRGELIVEEDDIDHFGNRRLRTVGELIQNQLRTGLGRMERVVRDRMTTQDVEAITPQTLINIRPVVAALKEFFGTSQLSQFMDQTNPVAGLTHKRRLSALGPGGLSRDRAGMEVRDVHTSHYGRMCPIETPEGPNIGLIGSLASFARVNAFGFVETPYRKVVDGRVTDQIDYLTADEEDRFVIAQANAKLDDERHASARSGCWSASGTARPTRSLADDVHYMDVSPRQMVSVATAMIPFLEHDDASRALMGSNMQRQAVPLLRSDAPFVGTGMEYRGAVDAGDVTVADQPGVVTSVSADLIDVAHDDGTYKTYRLAKFRRSNQGTCINQRPLVAVGQRVEKGTPLADGPCTDERRDGSRPQPAGRVHAVGGSQLRGRDHPVASASSRTTSSPRSTSRSTRSTPATPSSAPRRSPGTSRTSPRRCWPISTSAASSGSGPRSRTGDILVGKVTPKGETELTPEERLLRAIFGEKAREVRDTSLKVPHGESGTVIGVRVFDRDSDDELAPGVNQLVRVYVAQKRKISNGDKLAGRHGNKGVISKILPIEDMPFLEDGTAGRHRAQPARCAEPDERRSGAGDPPRVGGQAGLGPRRCRGRLGRASARRRPRSRRRRPAPRHPGVRRCDRGRRSPACSATRCRPGTASQLVRRRRQGAAVRRPLR